MIYEEIRVHDGVMYADFCYANGMTQSPISAKDMIIQLVESGVPLESIAIYNQMSETGKAQVRESLGMVYEELLRWQEAAQEILTNHITLTEDDYYNMAKIIERHMHGLRHAYPNTGLERRIRIAIAANGCATWMSGHEVEELVVRLINRNKDVDWKA